jgi:hypothetical protein
MTINKVMKIKSTILVSALALSLSASAQFFDTVPFRGAFGVTGTTKSATTGYNPDPTNTGANWATGWTNWTPNTTAYPGDVNWTPTAQHPATSANKVVLSGDLASNLTLTKGNWYELTGTVHVLNGATLTIEPGTVIRGNASNIGVLIIAKGGKLNAIGTKEQPIVFTSGKATGTRVRGDLGGLLLIGNAHTNTPGGVRQYEALPSDPLTNYGGGVNYNDADNSGTMRYIRVEYAGYNFLPDQEINGITFAGVGNGTHADYMQVSFANDDSYEWFGGSSNHKYLVAFAGTDDEFDMDEGYNGKCQYLLGVRNPAIFETSPTGTSNGLEHDNNTGLGTSGQINPGFTAPTPLTAPVISNMTLVGPLKPGAINSSLSSTAQTRFGRALEFRTNVSTSVFNSVVWGYTELIRLGNPTGNFSPSTQTRFTNDETTLRNDVFINNVTRFNSQNPPTTNNGNPFTFSVTDMRNILVNGPLVGFTGATANDTARGTLTAGVEFVNPIYAGNSNGSLNQIDFSAVDYTLTVGSPFNGTSSFSHPKILTVPSPTIAVDPSVLPVFNKLVDQDALVKWILVKASNLLGNIQINAPANFEVSFTRASGFGASITKNGPSANDTVFIKYTRNTPGSAKGFIAISSTVPADFSTVNISVSGNTTAPASPFLSVSTSSLSFSSALTTPSAEKEFVVMGKFVTANTSVVATAGFEVSTTSGSGFAPSAAITVTNGDVNSKVYVRYTPSVTGSVSGSIKIGAGTMDSVSVAVTGATPVATLTISPSSYPQWQVVNGDSSLAYPFTVSGVNLTDSVKITAPNASFQLSIDSAFTTPAAILYLNTAEAASLASTKLFVRYKPVAAAAHTGNVAITSLGATTANVAVSGLGVANTNSRRIALQATTNSLSFTTTLGTPSSSLRISVAGFNLTDTMGLAFSAPGFELSLDNTAWSTTLRLDTLVGKIVPTTNVWVRYNPSSAGASGAQQLIINSPSATTINMAVSGQSTPSIVVTPAVLPVFATVKGKPTFSIPVTVTGSRLISDITLTASVDFEVSLDSISAFAPSVTILKTGTTVAATKVFVRYNPLTSGNSALNSVLTIATQSAPSSIISLSGFAVEAPTPIINLSTASLSPFATNVAGPTAAQSFIVNAENLTDSLDITVGSDFELSPDSITYKQSWKVAGDANGSIVDLKLYCRLNRTTSGSSNDTIVVSASGAESGKIAVSGVNNTRVDELKNISSFTMYPNPAQSNVTFKFSIARTAETTINIMDITGRIVKEVVKENFVSGMNSVTVDIADLNNGFYFVNIQSLQGRKTSRILISK